MCATLRSVAGWSLLLILVANASLRAELPDEGKLRGERPFSLALAPYAPEDDPAADVAPPDDPLADTPRLELPDLSDFRTVQTAIKAEIRRSAASANGQTGFLGISVEMAQPVNESRALVQIVEVGMNSPAAKAGLRPGDLLLTLAGAAVRSPDDVRSLLQARAPGEVLQAAVRRGEETLELAVTLGATSRPMTFSSVGGTGRPVLGVRTAEPDDDGIRIESVTPRSPAERAGLRAGDVLVKIDETQLHKNKTLAEVLADRRAGERIKVVVRRDDGEQSLEVELAADTGFGGFFRGGREGQGGQGEQGGVWRKPVYRLAVIPVEYPDQKHDEKITLDDWHMAIFSEKTYSGRQNVTGQNVYGSVNDYYRELSYGAFKLEGKIFDWVEVRKNRQEYSQGTGTSTTERTVFLREVLDKLLEREGKDALGDFDGLFFLYAGERVRTTRGGLYWPHKGNFSHGSKRWSYFIVPEGGRRMTDISVICHEFGHMLGLPDLYARPENPGSEGLSVWCAMSNQAPNGRPQHFSAWCKEQLGWLKPAVIDPTVKQKLILAPVEDSPYECYKVLVRPDGSEYLLLENRRKKGFDASLPAEGLLIWRVVRNRPLLEESHGVEGPAGPSAFRDAVPYPSRANDAFTPYTIPSSRSQLGGGLPVHVTNIRELPDGRITFYIGYEFQ